MLLTAAGGPVLLAQEAREAHSPLGGPLPAPEPEKPVPELPSPAVFQPPTPNTRPPSPNSRSSPSCTPKPPQERAIGEGGRGRWRSAAARSGLAMTMALRKLMVRHNVRLADPGPLPLLAPIDAPASRIKGYAATSGVDGEERDFSRRAGPNSTRRRSRSVGIAHDLNSDRWRVGLHRGRRARPSC